MPSKKTLYTVALAVGTIAVLNRIDATRTLMQGDQKFLGIF